MKCKLGLMIDYFRKQHGLTLAELGKKLDKTSSAVSRWISGERSPMVEDLVKLTKLFDTDIETLMFGYDVSKRKCFYKFYESTNQFKDDPAAVEQVLSIELPDAVMGKYARGVDVVIVRVNGESMNNIIPNQSLVAVKPCSVNALVKNDIVAIMLNGEVLIKRFINDTVNKRFIFRPDSDDSRFSDYILRHNESAEVKLIGKVVVSIINY